MTAFHADTLNALIEALLRANLSRNSIHTYTVALASYFNWCKTEGILNISSLSDTPDRKKSDTLTAKILHPFRIDGARRPHGLRTAATPLDHSEIAFSRLMDSPLMVST